MEGAERAAKRRADVLIDLDENEALELVNQDQHAAMFCVPDVDVAFDFQPRVRRRDLEREIFSPMDRSRRSSGASASSCRRSSAGSNNIRRSGRVFRYAAGVAVDGAAGCVSPSPRSSAPSSGLHRMIGF